jgi:polysaccharide pyruvyl transferase WcaK-like protein
MEESGLELLLLPIGYASGHDDHQFLSKIHDIESLESALLFDLNMWEIMSLIKNSTIFIGTSLHGVVTAMSFGTPYIGLNPNIVKLQSFLEDWGTPPLNKCYPVKGLMEAFNMASAINHLTLQKHATKLHKLGLQSYRDLLGSMYPSIPTASSH